MAWESMLSFDECQSMLDTWLAKNHNAKPGTLRINRNGGKNNATWSGERGAVKGTFAAKPLAPLYPAGAQGRLGGGGGLHQRTGRSGLGKTRAHKRGCPITLYRWSL